MSVNVDKLLKVARRLATRYAKYVSRRGKHGPEKEDLLQQAALEALELYSAGRLKPFAKNIRARLQAYAAGWTQDHENVDDYEVSDHRPFVDPADQAELKETVEAVERLPEERRIAVKAMMFGRTQADLAENRGVSRQKITKDLAVGLRTLRHTLFGAA